MSSGLALLVFLGGLALSLAASEVLVNVLQRLGLKLGISAGLLGLLVALGADAPEISSAITATLSGARDVGVGVILGSNLFNLAALLGLSAAIAGRLRFRRVLLALDGGVALLTTLAVGLLLVAGLNPPGETALTLIVFVPYVALLSVRPGLIDRLRAPARVRHPLAVLARVVHGAPARPARPTSWRPAWWIAPAIAAIVLGSALMVTTALLLGDRWGLPRPLLGTVVLAALTSLPNAYAAVRLALRHNGEAVVSETFNSNTLNLLAGISLPALVLGGLAPVPGARVDLLWLLAMTLAAIALGLSRKELSRGPGLLLIAIYAAFLLTAVR